MLSAIRVDDLPPAERAQAYRLSHSQNSDVTHVVTRPNRQPQLIRVRDSYVGQGKTEIEVSALRWEDRKDRHPYARIIGVLDRAKRVFLKEVYTSEAPRKSDENLNAELLQPVMNLFVERVKSLGARIMVFNPNGRDVETPQIAPELIDYGFELGTKREKRRKGILFRPLHA